MLFRSLLFSTDPEIEIKTKLSDALNIIQKKNDVAFSTFYVVHHEMLISADRHHELVNVKISNIDLDKQLCFLGLKLKIQA